VLQRVLVTPAREGRISMAWTVPGVALALCLVALVVALVISAGTAHTDPIDAAHQPWIYEGASNRTALREGWVLALDPANRGQQLGWQDGNFPGQPVSLPRVANPLPITGKGGIKSFKGSIAWYRTTIALPSNGVYSLHFESVNQVAKVWLDGKLLGSPHVGTYLPFAYQFDGTAGAHTLVVRADYRNPNTQPGLHRTWFNFGGINGEVTLRPIGESDLGDPTFTTTLAPASDGSVVAVARVSVQVHNYGPARTITPTGSLSDGNGSTSVDFPPLNLAAGQVGVAQAQVTVSKPDLWSPQSPNLYDLDLKVGDESDYRLRVGLRQITWTGGHLMLNGSPLLLRGASIQEDIRGRGDALTPGDQDAIVDELRNLGANATRSQHPLDPGLLEKLDKAGILVWQGVGPVDPSGDWSSDTPALEAVAERRARVTINEAQTHPSIIAWNLANEVAGNGHPGGQAKYVEDLASWIHANDPGRLVALDIWGPHPPKVAGPIYSQVDAIGETNYLGWYESPLASQAELGVLIRQRLDSLHATFAHKVLIVSEFGAEANYLNPDPVPGSYAFQTRLLQTHINTYETLPYLSGMLVWDLRDFAVSPTFAGGSIHQVVAHINLIHGLNQKGLISYEGVEKEAFGTVARAFDALAKADAARARSSRY
jgi:hypothetical protein